MGYSGQAVDFFGKLRLLLMMESPNFLFLESYEDDKSVWKAQTGKGHQACQPLVLRSRTQRITRDRHWGLWLGDPTRYVNFGLGIAVSPECPGLCGWRALMPRPRAPFSHFFCCGSFKRLSSWSKVFQGWNWVRDGLKWVRRRSYVDILFVDVWC